MIDTGRFEPNLCHAMQHRVGTVKGRAVGQLCKGNQVLFVLGRNEAVGDTLKTEIGQHQQTHVDQQHQGL